MQNKIMVHMFVLLFLYSIGSGLPGLKAHGQTQSQPSGELPIGAAETSSDHLAGVLSQEQVQQEQMEVEAQINEERLQALEEAVRKNEARLDEAPSWWLPIILAAVLAFIFSHLAVYLDRSRTVSEKTFARITFPEFESSLMQVLKAHVDEINRAKQLVHKVLETPLLKVGEDDDFMNFKEDLWTKELTTLELIPTNVAVPSEGKHHTRDVIKQVYRYEKKTGALNQMLHEFSLLCRVRTSFHQPDQAALSQYQERLLAEHGVECIRDLVASEAFQTKASDLRDKILDTAEEVREQNSNLQTKLVEIRKNIDDV
jgi:hypothetical protein